MSHRASKKQIQPSVVSGEGSAPMTAQRRALVFISHDSRDAALAELVQNLLLDASGGVLKSFCSSDRKGTSGIEFGEEWYKSIMSKLGDATNVVALLTPNSLNRPWILYEAGVAKGTLETPVLGLVLGMSLEDANKGPFAQFQNCGDDEDSLTKLVLQLICKNPEASPREAAVRMQVASFKKSFVEMAKPWDKLIAKKPNPTDVDSNTVAKLFEEVKVMFRDLPDRLNESVRSIRPRHGSHGSRAKRHLLGHLMRSLHEESCGIEDVVFIGTLISEDAPLFVEALRQIQLAIESGSQTGIRRAMERLEQCAKYTMDFVHEGDHEATEEIGHFLHIARSIASSAVVDALQKSKARSPRNRN